MGFLQAIGAMIFLIISGILLIAFESFVRFLDDPWGYIEQWISFVLTPFDPILKPFGQLTTNMFLTLPFTLIGMMDDFVFPKKDKYVPSLADTGNHTVPSTPQYTDEDYYE